MLRQDLPGLRLLQTLSHIFLLALFSFNFCLGPWYMWPQFIFSDSWVVATQLVEKSVLSLVVWKWHLDLLWVFSVWGLICLESKLQMATGDLGSCSEVISEPSVRGGPLVEWDKELGSCSFSPWTTLWFDLMKDWDYTLTTVHFRLMAYVLNILLNVFFSCFFLPKLFPSP